jgi:hypothetical protein
LIKKENMGIDQSDPEVISRHWKTAAGSIEALRSALHQSFARAG